MSPPPSLSQLIDIMDRFQKTHWQLPTIHQKLKHRGAQHKGERVCINEADTLPEWWRCSGNTPSSSPWSGPGTTRRHRRHRTRWDWMEGTIYHVGVHRKKEETLKTWRKKEKEKISYLFFVFFLSSLKCSALHVARGRKQQQQLIFFFSFFLFN